jgi:hypothetical protein
MRCLAPDIRRLPGVWSSIFPRFLVRDSSICLVPDMRRLPRLAEGTNLPPVDRFGDRQRVLVVEGLPMKCKEFTWAKRVGHVQH